MTPTATQARLKTRYLDEVRPALMERFGYSSVMQAPKIEKITLNMGVGDAKNDSSAVRAAQNQMAAIAGQRPSVRVARKSVAAFKLREGMAVGVSVTLRGERGYEFLDRLTSIAIPRIRDFRGLSPRSFDGRGNYSMGVKEQIIFPEIDYGTGGQVRGMDITITTSAATDVEAFALLHALGMPFAQQGRPKDFVELFGSDQDADQAEPKRASKAAKAKPAPEPEPEAAAEPETEAAAEPEVAAEAEPETAAPAPDALDEAEAVAEEVEAVAEEAIAEAEIVGEAPAEAEASTEPEPEAAAEPEAAPHGEDNNVHDADKEAD